VRADVPQSCKPTNGFLQQAASEPVTRALAGKQASAELPNVIMLTKNACSPSTSWSSKISGSELTPAECATLSPKLRDMASPGMSAWASQTRAGPSIPSSYRTCRSFFKGSGLTTVWVYA